MRQIEGRNAIMEALKRGESLDTLYVAKTAQKEGSMIPILAKAREAKILVKTVDKNKIDDMAQTSKPQGVIAIASDFVYSDLKDVLQSLESKGKKGFFVVLDEIEDPHNLGAILRSAEGSGVDAVIIPQRRSAMVNATVEKVSAGATSYVNVIRVVNLVRTLEELQKNGYWVYSLDMEGEPYYSTEYAKGCILVVGNEGRGVSRLIKEKSDFAVCIPMKGKIDSLNASVAAGVVMMEVARKRELAP